MKDCNEKSGLSFAGFKQYLGFTVFFALAFVVINPAHAQGEIEVQIREAARDLEPAARAEFIELIRNPEELTEVIENLGVPTEVVERFQEVVPKDDIIIPDQTEKIGQEPIISKKLEKPVEKIDKVTRKLEKVDAKLENKISNIRDIQTRMIERATSTTLIKVENVIEKAVIQEESIVEEVSIFPTTSTSSMTTSTMSSTTTSSSSTIEEPVVEKDIGEIQLK